MRFVVLASGSAGNVSFVEANGFGLLIDVGLGPRQIAARLAGVGLSWQRVHAVLLTHTHSDHRNERTFRYLLQHRLPLWCHASHAVALSWTGSAFAKMRRDRLIRTYAADEPMALTNGLSVRPLLLSHDGGPTFGFRLEAAHDLFGPGAALGYATDLGCWDETLAAALTGVDLLALEFNHDEALEVSSGRSDQLIARVLSDEGHLSNRQAAALLARILARSPDRRPRRIVQLHLSRDCNRPELARQAALHALGEWAVEVHTARQDRATPVFDLSAEREAVGAAG
jgi:phosphoribosyl 1,2-cyclic phosphodiesterase